MILYPAIDVRDGRCVRLKQGDFSKETIFNEDPAQQAARFEADGFTWLHVVDLDGAVKGRPVNVEAIRAIRHQVKLPIQLGGGIRTMAAAAAWIDADVDRLILGTAALKDPAFVKEAAKTFPGRVAVGIDARNGNVATEGWTEESTQTAHDVARRFEDCGVAAIIYTDVARDGMRTGLDLAGAAALAENLTIPVTASGGFSSLEDVRRLMQPAFSRISGAIIGLALYDGSLDARTAIRLASAERPLC